MYKRIAVAVGDYLEIDTAVASALALAAHTDAELLRRRVRTAPLTFGAPDMVTCSHLALDHVIEAQAYVLACAVAAAEEAGVVYMALSRWGAIPDILVRTAEEADCDGIVVGSPASPGWPWPRSKYLARLVIARAPLPVLVVTQPSSALSGAPLWSRLLVVHDGSPGADIALEYALTLADTAYLDTCVLSLETRWRSAKIPCLSRAIQASTSLSMARPPATMAGNDHEVLALWGGIATILETAAERRCDVIVLSADQGLSWPRLWHGPIARTLMASTNLPLLVVNRFTAWKF